MSGSSLDAHTNNVSLFNMVEQINVPVGAPPPPNGVLPLELHAYFLVAPHELGRSFEVRHVLRAESGLETLSDVFTHRSDTPRFRTRTLGVPFPPVADGYELCLDWRYAGQDDWRREPLVWPLAVVELEERPAVTH
jgi:hypothetical protein